MAHDLGTLKGIYKRLMTEVDTLEETLEQKIALVNECLRLANEHFDKKPRIALPIPGYPAFKGIRLDKMLCLCYVDARRDNNEHETYIYELPETELSMFADTSLRFALTAEEVVSQYGAGNLLSLIEKAMLRTTEHYKNINESDKDIVSVAEHTRLALQTD